MRSSQPKLIVERSLFWFTEEVLLSRYPWAARCVHDNVGEFVGPEFQFLLQSCRIKDAPTSSKNPQANAICERMHQTVGNILCTLLHGEPPRDVTKAKDS